VSTWGLGFKRFYEKLFRYNRPSWTMKLLANHSVLWIHSFFQENNLSTQILNGSERQSAMCSKSIMQWYHSIPNITRWIAPAISVSNQQNRWSQWSELWTLEVCICIVWFLFVWCVTVYSGNLDVYCSLHRLIQRYFSTFSRPISVFLRSRLCVCVSHVCRISCVGYNQMMTISLITKICKRDDTMCMLH